MRNIHIVYAKWDKRQVKLLSQFGIKVEQKYDRFDIEEDENYFKIKPYLDKWDISDHVISKFSEEDLNSANTLVFNGVWSNGYPMPDNDNGYKKTTYDDKEYCEECGVGLIQKEPFRLKKEVNWGNKKVFQLGWICDELFIKKDFYETVFKKLGLEALPVLLYKKETIINDTVQLKIPVTDSSLQLDGYEYEVCDLCGRKRYNLINKGFFPSFEGSHPHQHLLKSREDFGTGASSRKIILLSSEIRNEFVKRNVKANYIPVAYKS